MEDLTGGPDERGERLAGLEKEAAVEASWLRRQLGLALEAWAADETDLDIEREARIDY